MITKLIELAKVGKFGLNNEEIGEETLKNLCQNYEDNRAPIYDEHPKSQSDLKGNLGYVAYIFFDDIKKSLLGVLNLNEKGQKIINEKLNWSIAIKKQDERFIFDHLALTNHPKIKGLKIFSEYSNILSFSQEDFSKSLKEEFEQFRQDVLQKFEKLGLEDNKNPEIKTLNKDNSNEQKQKILMFIKNSSLPKSYKEKINDLNFDKDYFLNIIKIILENNENKKSNLFSEMLFDKEDDINFLSKI